MTDIFWSWCLISWINTWPWQWFSNFTWSNANWKIVKKHIANLHNKTEYVVHIRNLKPALNHELALKKVHRVITFNQLRLIKRQGWDHILIWILF